MFSGTCLATCLRQNMQRPTFWLLCRFSSGKKTPPPRFADFSIMTKALHKVDDPKSVPLSRQKRCFEIIVFYFFQYRSVHFGGANGILKVESVAEEFWYSRLVANGIRGSCGQTREAGDHHSCSEVAASWKPGIYWSITLETLPLSSYPLFIVWNF